jgi:hypothetical protein
MYSMNRSFTSANTTQSPPGCSVIFATHHCTRFFGGRGITTTLIPPYPTLSTSSHLILDGELIVQCLVRKDLAKCRDSAGARAARVEHLLMVCGSAGPGVLFPFSKRRYVRPGVPEHAIVKKYVQQFHQLIHLNDIDVSELVVWTTRYRAEMVGKHAPESVCMLTRITEAIRADVLDEMSGGGTAVASSVVLAGHSCDTVRQRRWPWPVIGPMTAWSRPAWSRPACRRTR